MTNTKVLLFWDTDFGDQFVLKLDTVGTSSFLAEETASPSALLEHASFLYHYIDITMDSNCVSNVCITYVGSRVVFRKSRTTPEVERVMEMVF